MKQQIIDLSQKLIRIPSTKDNPPALTAVLDTALQELHSYTIDSFESLGCQSALVHNQPSGHKEFKLVLNAHLDVVAAKPEQFNPVIKKNKLFGRGALDMKSAAAVEILVFKQLARKCSFPIALQLVTDEEIGGFNGTRHQVIQGVRTNFCLAGEHTNFSIGNEAKGIIWLELEANGRTTHGSTPWNGTNALSRLLETLHRIEKAYPIPSKESWQTTCNLAIVTTDNQTVNKVPNQAMAKYDIRYIPAEAETIVPKLKSLIDNDIKITMPMMEPSAYCNPTNPYIKQLQQSTKKIIGKNPGFVQKHGGSDIRHYSDKLANGVVFGPIGEGIHQDNEWVDINSLQTYYDILVDFISAL